MNLEDAAGPLRAQVSGGGDVHSVIDDARNIRLELGRLKANLRVLIHDDDAKRTEAIETIDATLQSVQNVQQFLEKHRRLFDDHSSHNLLSVLDAANRFMK